MSKILKRGPAKAEMNMTPLIDVTFQLIIFFMLVNNIVSEESVEMIVPELQNAKTRELGEVDRITVNIAPMDFDRDSRPQPLNFEGSAAKVRIGLQDYAPTDLEAITASLTEAKARNPNVEILLRADAAAYYETVQPVMAAITAAGISTINLVAYMPDQGPSAGGGGQ
jgi:biopolymer transport protein ExbD